MGGFYGSIQVRTLDHAAVKTAAEQVARQKSIRCLLGPEINGWVGIYPEGNGQDDGVGRDIEQLLDTDVLHLLVHDDDVLAYWLWRKHELVDSYWSKPGYFGEENRENEEQRSGDPEQFRAIIGDKVGKLTAVLDRDEECTFEQERLKKLARLLGIKNSLTSYEYLGESDGSPVMGRRQFLEIPTDDKTDTKKIEREAAARKIRDDRKRFKLEGILLAHHKDAAYFGGVQAVAGGFICFPTPHLYEQPSSLHFHSPPWKVPTTVGFDLPPRSNPFNIRADWSGHWVAAQADSAIRIWNWNMGEAKHVVDLPTSQFASVLDISFDGRRILESRQNGSDSNREIAVHDVAENRVIATINIKGGYAALPPGGEILIVAAETLDVIDLKDQTVRRTFQIGSATSSTVYQCAQVERVGCVGFSRDGRWLWCGTNMGLHVYESVRFSKGETVPPTLLWTIKPPELMNDSGYTHVHSIVEEFSFPALVFGGWGSSIMRLDLETGAVRRLIEIPEATFVASLTMTPDGRYLGVTANNNQVGNRNLKCWFEVWDYGKLFASEFFRTRDEVKKSAAPSKPSLEEMMRQGRIRYRRSTGFESR